MECLPAIFIFRIAILLSMAYFFPRGLRGPLFWLWLLLPFCNFLGLFTVLHCSASCSQAFVFWAVHTLWRELGPSTCLAFNKLIAFLILLSWIESFIYLFHSNAKLLAFSWDDQCQGIEEKKIKVDQVFSRTLMLQILHTPWSLEGTQALCMQLLIPGSQRLKRGLKGD